MLSYFLVFCKDHKTQNAFSTYKLKTGQMSINRCTLLSVASKQTKRPASTPPVHIRENILNSYLLTMYDLVKRSYSGCALCSTFLGFSILMVVGCGPANAAPKSPFSLRARNCNLSEHLKSMNEYSVTAGIRYTSCIQIDDNHVLLPHPNHTKVMKLMD